MKRAIVAAVIIAAVLALIYILRMPKVEEMMITNFEECAAAGNPVMESYPARCTHDGVTYTQEVADAPNGERIGETNGEPEGENVTVAGVITAIDTEQTAVDGPARVTVVTDLGAETVIAIPVFFVAEYCPGMANVADYATLKVGDKVEAQGYAGEDNLLIPCQSSEHYLRVVE